MHCQLFQSSRAHRVDASIVPDICPIATMLTELKIVDVCCAPGLPHEHQFMLGAVERAYTGVGLVPDTEVLELAELAAGGEHLPHVAPVHADLVDRAVNGVLGEPIKYRFQEGRELDLAHLAAAHGELAMTNATETTDVAVDGHVVGRVREHEFRLGAFEQTIVGSPVAGICAQQTMMPQQPELSGLGDRGAG